MTSNERKPMIQQTAFYIPPDVTAGLLTGDLVRYGGVVRQASGEIYKHLKEIDLPEVDAKKLRLPLALKNPWVVMPVVATTVVAAGAGTYVLVKRHRRTQVLLKGYREALAAYVGALQEGCLDASVIDRLSGSLDALLDADSGANQSALESLDHEAKQLSQIVVDSTKQLIEDNGLTEPAVDIPAASTSNAAVIELLRRLDAQRSVFDEAA